ncbi:hypothetical protein JCM11641_006428 [Rhodosporidiobolus odoratus]
MLRSTLDSLPSRSGLHRLTLCRTVWTTRTLVSSDPQSLLTHLDSLQPPCSSSTTLYALSKNVPQSLVPAFRSACNPPSRQTPAVGCLSELLHPDLFSLSLAHWTPDPSSSSSSPIHSHKAVVFRSTLTGRPNIALGREIKPDPTGPPEADEDEARFQAFLRGDSWGFGNASPPTRAGPSSATTSGVIEGLEGIDPAQVKELVCFTADRIQPFLSALSSYPSAAVAGLLSSSTPFHSPTHAPFELFLGPKETFSSGAVGIAVIDSAPESRRSQNSGNGRCRADLDYGGLEQLGEGFEVTNSKGNILLTLSSQNAARTLLNLVNSFFGTSAQSLTSLQRAHEKEKEFYAAVFDSSSSSVAGFGSGGEGGRGKLNLKRAKLVARINAGDPSRGAMSVETEEEIKVGDWIAFLHRPSPSASSSSSSSSSSSASTLSTQQKENSLTFLSLSPSYHHPSQSPSYHSHSATNDDGRPRSRLPEVVEVEEWPVFVAGSENGVIHSVVSSAGAGSGDGAGRAKARVCQIEGVRVVLS